MRKVSAKYFPYPAENFIDGLVMVAHLGSSDIADTIGSARLSVGSNEKKPETKVSGYQKFKRTGDGHNAAHF